MTGNSKVPIPVMLEELVQLGASSTGRTQPWERSVNSALCCWNVSTLRFLIIQALIKDLEGEIPLFLWDQREVQLLPVFTQPWSCCCITHTQPLLHPELELQP